MVVLTYLMEPPKALLQHTPASLDTSWKASQQEFVQAVDGRIGNPLVNVRESSSIWSLILKFTFYSTILFLSAYAAVNCGTLGSPDFGQVSWTSTFFNGVATYSCFTGYVLIGQRERRCEGDGNWSGQPPQCEREYYLALYNYMAYYVSEKQRYEMNS